MMIKLTIIDLSEFFSRFWIAVRMVLFGKLSEGLSDLLLGGTDGDFFE